MSNSMLAVFMIIVIMIASILRLCDGTYATKECKIEAIKHNIPVLEIKELCK